MQTPNSNSPPPSNPGRPPGRRSWRRWLGRTLLVTGGIVGIGSAAGIWWLDRFVKTELSPLLSQELSKTLDRPVTVGTVERYGLTSLRVGPSSIPATATDPDRANIAAIEVSFNPLQLITRHIDLALTLVNPDLYLQQEQNGVWVRIPLQLERPPGPITSEIRSVTVTGGRAALSPAPRPGSQRATIVLDPLNGTGIVSGRDEQRQIALDVNAQAMSGGQFTVQGDIFPQTGNTNLQVRLQQVALADISQLIQKPLRISAAGLENSAFLPVAVGAGQVDGTVAVTLQPSQLPSVTGTLDITDAAIAVTNFPSPITLSQGRLRLKGQQIQLENVVSRVANAEVVISGNLDTQYFATDPATAAAVSLFDLTGKVTAPNLADLLAGLRVRVPVPIVGAAQGTVQLTGSPQNLVVSGSVETSKPLRIDKVDFNTVRTGFRVAESVLTLQNLQASLATGGTLKGDGRLSLGGDQALRATVQLANVNGDRLVTNYATLPPDLTLGVLTATATVSGTLPNPQGEIAWQAASATYPGSGRILIAGDTILVRDTRLAADGGTLQANGQIRNGAWQADITTDAFQLAPLSPNLQGTVSGQVALSGRLDALRANSIQANGNFRLAQGIATVKQPETVGLTDPLTASFAWDGQQLNLTRVDVGGLTAQGVVVAQVQGDSPQITRVDMQVSGRNVALRSLPIPQRRLSQAGITALSGQTTLQGRITGTPSALTVDGTVAINQFSLARSGSAPLQVNQLNAALRWDGRNVYIRDFNADGSTVSGVIATNTPEPQFDLQLRLRDYNLAALPIPPIKTPQGRLTPQGLANYTGRLTGTPSNLSLLGDLALNQVALVQPGGKPLVQWTQTNFSGGITGAISSLRANGGLQVRNLQALGQSFEPVLRGTVDYTLGQGGAFNLSGDRDRITVALGADNSPNTFYIKRDQFIADGRRQGDQLVVMLQEFPVENLQLAPLPNYGSVAGIVSGTVNYNLRQQTGFGQVDIRNPTVGYLSADRFSGKLSYINGVATLTDGTLQIGRSRYGLNANLTPGKTPRFAVDVQVAQGRVQDLLSFFKWFDLADIARGLNPPNFDQADSLVIFPVGDPNTVLGEQIRRLSEIDQLLAQQVQQSSDTVLPDLREARGNYSGTIAVTSTAEKGLAATFNIQGDNWELAPYRAETVTIQGDFKDGILTLQPLRLASKDNNAFLVFAGPLSLGLLSGQVRAQNLPINDVVAFFDLPVDISGKLNGTVSLSGEFTKPKFQGQISLVDGAINDEPIDAARAGFNYGSQRINFRSVIEVQSPDPLEITGSLPAPLPFDTDRLAEGAGKVELDATLENAGLALLNVFTRQVNWVSGKGAIAVKVRGDLDAPVSLGQSPLDIKGTLALQDAVLRVQGLPDPVTDVTGKASFQGDRILVEGIQGLFSEGTILVKGYLPLSLSGQTAQAGGAPPVSPVESDALQSIAALQTQPPENLPLTLGFDQVALNLKGLYRGQARGIVQVRGSALDAQIGGSINLFRGQLFLPDQTAQSDPANQPVAFARDSVAQPPEFDNLQISLGNGLLITSPPLLSFVSQGDLFINGTIGNLRPSGTIRLVAGQVNIGTAQLNLSRGAQNTATFTPTNGLDPELNIQLVTSVQEVVRQPIFATSATGFSSSERADLPAGSLGALQTVRVRAEVNGPASELRDRLTLTSSPPRSETELLGLLGGGFVSGLQQGDTGLALANLATTALLSQLQSLVGNAVGITDFRLFPALVSGSNQTDQARRSSSSTLGLAAEIGTDFTDNLSLSLLQVLGSDLPTQYSLRYRLSDEFLLRGSTDFSGDSRAVLEFNTRF